ncbi:hypothetical protein P5G51_005095 [Virgibacillus sp. 179-BFC.A HS]|uniref:Uncharacterized protein n=1 Tax=Tigheibacillus jepli TaxID=3035914 RepID=A0ABU5CEW7_9BACI|nr:hypothetical protein [Virgibacillus sp. 179-BFC.A HS]MDY0404859.1 hypothetical protein [Virgibacillus sp. 179-BFC.A HS]
MKYIYGLYASLVIVFLVQLANMTIFDDSYSGIATFISLGVFIIGTAFFVSVTRLKISEKE